MTRAGFDDEERAVIIEPIDPGIAIDPRDRARRDELAQALGILRDIERSSRTIGLRAALLAFRLTLDPARLPGDARAEVEAAAWKLFFLPGDARLWSLLGRPAATPEDRQAALRRLFVLVDDPLALLDRVLLRLVAREALLQLTKREALRKAAKRRAGRHSKHDFAQVAEGALRDAGFQDRSIARALRALRLRRASRRARAACAAALLHAWPRSLRH